MNRLNILIFQQKKQPALPGILPHIPHLKTIRIFLKRTDCIILDLQMKEKDT